MKNEDNRKAKKNKESAAKLNMVGSLRARQATGPKTSEGKMRSKYNAVRHSIFTQVSIQGYESEKKFRRLHEGLREAWQPVGMAEERKVRELAILHQKAERVHLAEKAEIEKTIRFLPADVARVREAELRKVDTPAVAVLGGLLRYAHNPLVFRRCRDTLTSWRQGFAEHGFNLDHDWETLAHVYGWDQQQRPTEDLPFAYNLIALLLSKEQWDTEEDVPNIQTPPDVKGSMLKEIDTEIERLTERVNALEKEDAERLEYEVQTQFAPVTAERFDKYLTTTYRHIDKLEIQLERMQRRRRGEKDLPPLKVDLSS